MTKLEQLIEQLCPNGVEHKNLVDCINIKRGTRVIKKQLSNESGYPVFQNSLTPLGYYSEYNCNKNTTFIIVAGAAGDIGYSDVNFWAADDCFCLIPNDDILSRYIFHVLLNQQHFIYSKVRKASIPRLSRIVIEKIKLPVPPIEIQAEIVRILDNFTEQVAELKDNLSAELSARKKQYEYYRDEMLRFDTCFKEISLGDIFDTVTDYVAAGSFASIAENVKYKNEPDYAQLVRTTDIKSNFTRNDYVYIDKKAFEFLWRVNLDVECIIMPNIGVNCGEVYYLTPEKLPYKNNALAPNALLLRSNTNSNKFLSYYFQTKSFQDKLHKIISPGGQTKFNKTELKKIKISIPNLDIQNKIVNVLDNFEAICSDLNIGLPAEIEARQKQYEYYRDLLLTLKCTPCQGQIKKQNR